MLRFLLLAQLAILTLAYRPLQPYTRLSKPVQGDVGEPLYLTEFIKNGSIAEGKNAARVTGPLVGISEGEKPESFSGFLTVDDDPARDHNMFFWFFPATEVDPATAPVVMWLQGGPGGSSMFGLLEIHGPIQAVFAGDSSTTGELNPYTWARKANMLYMDNPVGAGYSYARDTSSLPTTQTDVANDLYEALQQFFTIFSEYQSNEFFPFGESYAGKFVPTIARKIHDENNLGAPLQINLGGLGVGDGFMSPPDSSIYADFLYQLALVDENMRDQLLSMEAQTQSYIDAGLWNLAWLEWNNEFGTFLGAMGCDYYYDITYCELDPEEDNYFDYMTDDITRKSVHVGNRPFNYQSGDVYTSMIDDFMRSERDNVEFLLNNYRFLIYDGNMDIICNHSGILKMFEQMTTWVDIGNYRNTERDVYRYNGKTIGYLKSVGNLRMFVMRNAGHMVPRSQPENALDVFGKFIDGTL